MWRNYATVAFRSLAKNRTYAVINIVGLAIGIAACLLILLYVRDQTSFDRFVGEHERVFQLQATNTDTETGSSETIQNTPYAVVHALAKDFDAIESFAYTHNDQPVIRDRTGAPVQETIMEVEPAFFWIFKIPFIHGDPRTALKDPNSVAIDESTARAMFGTDAAVGRTITQLSSEGPSDYRVSAVYADLPRSSHQAFGIVRRLVEGTDIHPDQVNAWGWFSGTSYVKLKPGQSVDPINAQLDAWKERVAPRYEAAGKSVSEAAQSTFKLVPLADVYLSGADGSPSGRRGNATTIAVFAGLAVLILAMACVNFTNLATARASARAREVSLRKVLGADRSQLIGQFLTESLIVTAIATMLALAVVELSLPWLRSWLGADIAFRYLGTDGLLLPTVGLTLLVGVLAGLYPAFYLTRFRPAEVLKANKSSAEPGGSGRLRNTLVVVQFAISIGLIICTVVVYAQLTHVRTMDPGFDREGVLQIDNLERGQVKPLAETLQREIARVPGVRSSALTSIGISTSNTSNLGVTLPGHARELVLGAYSVDHGFAETMGMRLLAGRTLSRDHALDDASLGLPPDNFTSEQQRAAEEALQRRGINVMVNESSARQMGFRSPAEAIGKQISMSMLSRDGHGVPATIVGVLGDTRFRSAHREVEDMILFRNGGWLPYLEVRFDGDPAAVRERVEAVWKRLAPDVPFDAEFADERAAGLYARDEAVGQMFAGFAILAVIVGCLGLFGLAAFTTERRTKEIGIRKVLGARTRDIVRLLVWQFSRPVLLANLIAWPIAWWAMRDWLNGFDARVALGPTPFLLASGGAAAIAVATVATHAIRVARANPVGALRYE
ncbi:putative ABC transport system permease protein [Sphingomonas jejuensis]|uniref:ABC transport system permease protein n=1 Tax=Sphingomonas jejuensis TaxID=904715 RepID=A0ABX0XPQ8_9SPHN|nr:FtsX-like permease family protein [Sphingomonas jejuensis]NJC35220.1 putative ABC transport system permease protein [Sphingomonas jejuensis]